MKQKRICPYCELEIGWKEQNYFQGYHEYCFDFIKQEERDSW